MIKFIIIFLGIFAFNLVDVNAQSYTNTTNLFDGSTSQQLFNIGMSRVDKFLEYNYIIFQNDTNYYMLVFKDYNYVNNVLTANDVKVFRYYREGTGYDYRYNYQYFEESSSTFTTSYIFVSNLNINNSSGSPIHQELLNSHYNTWLLVLLVGLIFAMFLSKGVNHYG